MLNRCMVALVLLVGGSLAPAQAQVTMQWKFEKGEVFYVEDVQHSKMAMTILGNTQKQDMDQTTLAKVTILDKSDAGIVMERKIESFKIVSSTPDPLADEMGKQLQGLTFKITFKPNMEVAKVEGLEEFLSKLNNVNPLIAQGIKQMFSEETLKAGLADAFGNLPNKLVAMGDTWSRKSVVPLGPMGTLTADSTFTYGGPQDGLHKVGLKGVLSYKPPKPGEGGVAGVQISKADLKADDAKGTLYYDAAKGKIVRSETKMKMKMSLTAMSGGQNLQMEMDQDMTMTSRLLDKPPSAGKDSKN
jgi:hypothetical protein